MRSEPGRSGNSYSFALFRDPHGTTDRSRTQKRGVADPLLISLRGSAPAGLVPWRDLRHTRPHPQTTADDSTVFHIVRICGVRQLFVEPSFPGPVCSRSTFLIVRLIPSGSGIRLCAGPFGLSAHISELKSIGPSGGILLSSPSFILLGIINSGSF